MRPITVALRRVMFGARAFSMFAQMRLAMSFVEGFQGFSGASFMASARKPHGIFTPLTATSRGMNKMNVAAGAVPQAQHGPKETLPALMLGAIGVVFGDIGTSPLYAMK